MHLKIAPARGLRGTIRMPGDKSISHRAVMLGALAEGTTRVFNFLRSEDCLATVRCFQELGIRVDESADMLSIQGRGLHGLKEPEDVLNAGNSGTTMRLLTGILAGQEFFTCLSGDASLRSRPMSRVVTPLTEMGAKIWGRAGGAFAPLAIRGGGLRPIDYRLPVASAQVKSALILAALFADGCSRISEPIATRDHTERMLSDFGVSVKKEGDTIFVHPGQKLMPRDIHVPGDISSAAFFIVAALITPESDLTVENVGINPGRTGILDALISMGAKIDIIPDASSGAEPTASVRVRSSRLKATEIGGAIIPRMIDEIPVFAVAAALAEGRTVIRDASELKVKESNRLFTTALELRRLGARVDETPDGLLIDGVKELRGTKCDSHGDHRIAMSMAVAGLAAKGATFIEGAEAISISFPGFTRVLNEARLQY